MENTVEDIGINLKSITSGEYVPDGSYRGGVVE